MNTLKYVALNHIAHIALGALLFIGSTGVRAHNEDLRNLRAEPRIGQVSEEVAREKLKTYGVTNVKSLRRVGDHYQIEAELDGKTQELEMHTLSGLLRRKGETATLAPNATRGHELLIKPNLELQRPDRIPGPQ